MQITGKVIKVLQLQGGTSANGKSWQLETFIIETLEQYSRKVCIEVFGEQRIKENPVNVDKTYTISFDLESREFNDRWYTSVRAWKIQEGVIEENKSNPEETAQSSSQETTQQYGPTSPEYAPQQQYQQSNQNGQGGLPF